ncbi:MAG: hypothetical protein UT98_C0001G0121 [Candidatus Nomurabacteria bacterium GW2011_GWF2_40_31]|uniref:Uncharacterized protein n=2 Tax=Candidatus Nomuraibacteriota TaxID=1752729 RepID=A0A837HUR7_9BACT|nr:MAG: hypothetical protein UT27_C0001G0047 [Candidatus Nomurabacteria bacterium GW2011_GWD2_39_12]KKR20686.1 MAG: hypothetical protein UT51_C0002G0121 [Candidatus Nomurabacteria bacterium GW2011_GWC2_39_41]KKR38633.1 MAG: hypothetical protein UT73_C0002G0118 [Candidatus Nomurabacteria bacterium GW2011_GWB1_40_11]KKR40358.1 MAG: hypothetical protein UT74_C0001G0092 [Parcubacteria group bacterium GW2011_GWC1_40_11]KKR59533.1 MAG: hypothetical protein UT98_C0001G0121 [Candidatus Nomurabacteria b
MKITTIVIIILIIIIFWIGLREPTYVSPAERAECVKIYGNPNCDTDGPN